MRFSYEPFDSMGRASLRAHRDDGDAPLGVSVLTFDRGPKQPTDDQVAVAATLAFGHHAMTQLEFPGRLTPSVRAGIERATRMPVVALSNDDAPADPTPAPTRLLVSDAVTLEPVSPPIDVTRLTLLPGERFSGSLVGVKEIVVGSNAWLFGRFQTAQRALTAAAVLFSHDLLVGIIEIVAVPPELPEERAVISDLCLTLGLET